jgi:hypothetical protein
MKTPVVLAAGLVALTAIALGATRRAAQPLPAHDVAAASGAGCRCHAGSVLADHTPDFVERDHGPAARTAPARCASCHRDATRECAACHEQEAPAWHDDLITRPDSGVDARRAHGRAAREHARGCGGCHAARFATECASCHRASEAWVRGDP